MKPKQRERMLRYVAALRSGKYKQVTGVLRRDDGFCCLGLACELYRQESSVGCYWRRGGHGIDFVIEDPSLQSSSSLLPSEIMDHYGFGDHNPVIDVADGHVTATEANDTLRWTFAEIADAVERTYLAGAAEQLPSRGEA